MYNLSSISSILVISNVQKPIFILVLTINLCNWRLRTYQMFPTRKHKHRQRSIPFTTTHLLNLLPQNRWYRTELVIVLAYKSFLISKYFAFFSAGNFELRLGSAIIGSLPTFYFICLSLFWRRSSKLYFFLNSYINLYLLLSKSYYLHPQFNQNTYSYTFCSLRKHSTEKKSFKLLPYSHEILTYLQKIGSRLNFCFTSFIKLLISLLFIFNSYERITFLTPSSVLQSYKILSLLIEKRFSGSMYHLLCFSSFLCFFYCWLLNKGMFRKLILRSLGNF